MLHWCQYPENGCSKRKPRLWADRRQSRNNREQGPANRMSPDKRCGLNRSMQHHLV